MQAATREISIPNDDVSQRRRCVYVVLSSQRLSSTWGCRPCAKAFCWPNRSINGSLLSVTCVGLHECFLVQLQEYVKPEHIFTEYAYFSSYSTSWVQHARGYCELVAAGSALDRRAT